MSFEEKIHHFRRFCSKSHRFCRYLTSFEQIFGVFLLILITYRSIFMLIVFIFSNYLKILNDRIYFFYSSIFLMSKKNITGKIYKYQNLLKWILKIDNFQNWPFFTWKIIYQNGMFLAAPYAEEYYYPLQPKPKLQNWWVSEKGNYFSESY